MQHEPRPTSPRPDALASRRAVFKGIGAGAAITLAGQALPGRAFGQSAAPIPLTSHPRLWITGDDLPRLRRWATEANPLWSGGMLAVADMLVGFMEGGHLPDDDPGGNAYETYPCENAAEFFAFLSLVHPDEDARTDFAKRAHILLMHVIDEAAKGPATGEPFRDPYFSTDDRSRWWGEAFPLTVDWIYPTLSATDQAKIRDVFLRWCEENTNAEITTYNHPEPNGVVNDPALTEDPIRLRWAGNNYFTAHMRNIGLMALALDPEDDPDGELAVYLESATGAWLYMVDALLRGDSRGGFTAEGFEYTQQALAYVVQFQLALHTAGQADPDRWGPQVILTDQPFWDEAIPAFLHSLSPATTVLPDLDWLGPVYQPAWFGDGESYWGPDFIGLFGALGRYDDLTNNTARLEALRWIQIHTPPGGAGQLTYRMSGEFAHVPILYFLLFDPEAGVPADPRPELAHSFFAPGIGRYLERTSWDGDATWFTWALGWNTVDHQHGDGNQVEFYRGGEWLTKERTGYGFNIGSSDYHNTLALENDPPDHNMEGDFRSDLYKRGSQWMIVTAGDPEIVARSGGEGYFHATGDATNLYNSEAEISMDIVHASRSVVWLKPDHIVIYDRAESKTDGRFKRFWLNFPAEAVVDGTVTTMTTATGQHLVISTLLPADAEIATEPAEPLTETGEPAAGEPMLFRLRVEAPGGPTRARFLHVLQGVDPGGAANEVLLIESNGGTPYAGAVVGETAVLFPGDLGEVVRELTYTVPAAARRHLITGLVPGSGYDSETQVDGSRLVVTIRPGTGQTADDGGVLSLEP
jgi:hypothetical protein